MIRAIALYDQTDRRIFSTNFARFNINFNLLASSILGAKGSLPHKIEHVVSGMHKISFLLEPNSTIAVLADRTNEEEEINKYLNTISEEVSGITDGEFSQEIVEKNENEIAEMIEENLETVAVKVTFAGAGGVGKTTMVKLLAKDERVLEYNPTLLADVEQLRIRVGPFRVALFTVAGQPRYRKTWDIVGEATDIVVLVLNSDKTNLRNTKEKVLPKVRNLMPYSRLVAIANKQDLPGVLSPSIIQEELGIPTYGMVAIQKEAKQRLLSILQHMITEVS